MNKIILLTLWLSVSAMAAELPTEYVKNHLFGKSVELNSKVIQLSNAQQSVMSLVDGYIEKYYVAMGEKVKAGQKIALIKSTVLSKMSSDYISFKEQFIALDKNYNATKTLYDKGMTSMLELNAQSIQRDSMLNKIASLKSQLETLGIEDEGLKKASSDYMLYAHSAGTVSALLQSLHSVVSASTPIISIVKDQAFYIKSYLPLEYADAVKIGQKVVVSDGKKKIITRITQILPELDEKTQRIIILSNIDEKVDDLYINSYLSSTLYFNADKEYLSVKKIGAFIF
jgi:multidrug efflux pump subunit AcrA (membrane-fusion protein)